MHLDIACSSILTDFGNQVGRKNRAKIDQKWHRKNDGKKKGSKIAKKAQKVRTTTSGTRGPRPRYSLNLGRGKLLPSVAGATPPSFSHRFLPFQTVPNRFPTVSNAERCEKLAKTCEHLQKISEKFTKIRESLVS